MKYVMTVLGPVAPQALGFCQSHEHLCILDGQSARCNPALRIDDPQASRLELEDYRAAGGGAVVDAQPVGCGRDAEFLARISRESGVHVVASTGFHKLMFYPEDHWIFRWDEDALAELYRGELAEGMFAPCDGAPPARRTAIRAGQIKTALDAEGLTPRYEKLFRAAARAQTATGAPLMVHTEFGSDPGALADFLEGQGVDLTRVIFCHMDRTVAEPERHAALCRRGIAMEYDTVARGKYHGDGREVELVRLLLDGGLEDRLLMSLDVTRARLRRYGGEVGLCYILETFLPLLRACGVSGAQINRIFYQNPMERFAIE